MLSQTALMKLTISELYNLYYQVYNKLEQRKNFVENYIRQKTLATKKSSNMGTVSTKKFPLYQLKETHKTWLSAVV